ncbi:MAG: hypothetical protein RL604_1588, partial [Pseudomonadota bacterium]
QAAWKDVLYRAKLNQHHTITREQLSVRDFMTRILRRLQGERFIEFTDLFEDAIATGQGAPMVQAEPYAPIYVRLAYSPN